MKKCTRCKKKKKESEFFFKNKAKNILHSHCKECKRKTDRAAYKKNTNGRSTRIRINALRQNERATNYVVEVKKHNCCCRCGEKRWYVLDFHHLRDKLSSVSALVQRGASIETLKVEIAKCEIVCANCHREIHYLQTKK